MGLERRSVRALRWAAGGLVLFLIAALFIGGAQPVAVNLVPAPWDKLAHLALFATVAWCAVLALAARSRYALGWGGLLAIVLGALDEWHQLFLPGRSADLSDLLADAFGTLLGVAVAAWVLACWPALGHAAAKRGAEGAHHD